MEPEEETPLLDKDKNVPGTKLNVPNLIINNVIIVLLSSATHIYEPVKSQYIYHRVADSVFGNDSRIKNFTVLAPCFQNTSDEGYRLVEMAQEITSTKLWELNSVAAGIAVLSTFVLGSYSDIIGRKFLFLCPMLGHLLRNAMTAVIIHWKLDLRFFFLATGIDGLLGGGWAAIMASMAFAADNTPPEQSRSLNLIIIESVLGLSESIASTATGYFIQNTGFFYPSLTSAAITLLAMILVAIFIKRKQESESEEQGKSIFSGMKNIKDIYFGGPKLNRGIFWVGLLCFFFATMNMAGGSNLDTLFYMDLPFCWSPEKMGIYDTTSTVVRKTVGVGLVRILQCCCSDSLIGILGALSDSVGSMMFAFATVDWMLYLGYPVLGIIGFTPTPIARGILSKQVPSNRQGAIFASMAVLQAVCSIFSSVVFNNIYRLTVSFWGGAVYVAFGSSAMINAMCFIILMVLLRKQQKLNNVTKVIQAPD